MSAAESVFGPIDFDGPVIGFSAASCSGKTFFLKHLYADGLITPLPSWTTRPPRSDEVDTVYDHQFVNPLGFEKSIFSGMFAITAELYGNSYGLPVPESALSTGLPLCVAIKPGVAAAFRETFPGANVFHLEATDGEAKAAFQMQKRGQSPDDIVLRIARYGEELISSRAIADRPFVFDGHPKSIFDSVARAVAEASA